MAKLVSELKECAALRTRLEALEKWGREAAKVLMDCKIVSVAGKPTKPIYDQARTLGLVEEK